MTPELLPLLMCPHTRQPLVLKDAKKNRDGTIVSGTLVVKGRKDISYPVINGIPRFVPQEGPATRDSVTSFGDQWNFFNFDAFRANWINDVVVPTFGGPGFYKGKTVVDAGAGSGMMTRWLHESGAKHVIALELSHSVDGIMQHNLKGLKGIDIIQCSIDAIPLKDGAIANGLVGCTNVIQHTPSVENTARELWRITGKGSEMAFNCYIRDDSNLPQRLRYRFYKTVRGGVSKLPFAGIMAYAHLMSALRLIPVVGAVVEKADLMRRGTVADGPHKLRRLYHSGVLNTFDYFGSHAYQHHKSFSELQKLADELQPDRKKQTNRKAYFVKPQPAGLMLRVVR